MNPTTTVGASKLKGAIKTKELADFDDDVIKYNAWFEDTRELIIKKEGEGYNEYSCSLFRAYKACSNLEFQETIVAERKD